MAGEEQRERRKSKSGYIIMLDGGLDSWRSKRQSTVVLSSTEAEYVALPFSRRGSNVAYSSPGDDQSAQTNAEKQGNIAVQALMEDVAQKRRRKRALTELDLVIESLPKSVDMRGYNRDSIALAHNNLVFQQGRNTSNMAITI